MVISNPQYFNGLFIYFKNNNQHWSKPTHHTHYTTIRIPHQYININTVINLSLNLTRLLYQCCVTIDKIDAVHPDVGHTYDILTLKDKDNYLFLGFCVYFIVQIFFTQYISRQRCWSIPHYEEKVKDYPKFISLYFSHLYNIYDDAQETASMVVCFDLGVGCFLFSASIILQHVVEGR